MVAALPADLPGSVLVTTHTGENVRSRLPWLLSRAGPLAAAHAEMGETLQPGRIYVAPPGCHLLLPGGVVVLSDGPRVNSSRPAVDVMFASAARWFGDRVVAVVLSGLLDDGAVGAALVQRAGGLVMAQEPGEAAQPSMPRAALAAAPGASAVPAEKLGEVAREMLGESGLTMWPRRCCDAGCCCDGGHQVGPKSLTAAQGMAETKLRAMVATLEATTARARHLTQAPR
jgi:two-component system chemotaxis response regulator CheB